MAHSRTFCAISNCSYTRGVILSLTCLGSGRDGLEAAEDKKEEEEVVGKELAKK